jgi:hypothetical protein
MLRHQLHLWVRPEDYRALRRLAEYADEPITTIVRRLIRDYVKNHSHELIDQIPTAAPTSSDSKDASRPYGRGV